MTRDDRKVLFNALAFFAVIMRGKESGSAEAAEDMSCLASLAEAYCNENAIKVPASVCDETGALLIDQIIAQHMTELRQHEMTRLPEDRATLIKVLDRLEHRKMRRASREIYAFATEAALADQVLELLDEEFAAEGNKKLS